MGQRGLLGIQLWPGRCRDQGSLQRHRFPVQGQMKRSNRHLKDLGAFGSHEVRMFHLASQPAASQDFHPTTIQIILTMPLIQILMLQLKKNFFAAFTIAKH